MDNKTVVTITMVLIILICAGVAVTHVINGKDASVRAFTMADNGKTVTVHGGETFKISLDGNPTTGYSWANNTTTGLAIVNDTYLAPSGGLVGAGGVHEWQVKATGAGSQEFSGIYMRPWEPAYGNETTFRLNIQIT